jgi:transposase
MIIIGVDFHPEFQQIASVDTDTGEFQEKRLAHHEDAEAFYRALAGQKVRVGMEASGHARWFERLLAELQMELWVGDAAEIRAKRVRKQKTDRQDAQLILRLLLEDRFPQIWVPSWENRDLRQLLWHRHRMVQARTRIMNQLQAVALNEGLRCKKRLWREHGRQQLESFRLAPWASRRRRDLLEWMDRLNPTIAELSQAIEQEVEKCPEAERLRTHPGVGALTALAFVLIIGRTERIHCGKQVASYLGLVPLEESSGNRRRLGQARQFYAPLSAGGSGAGDGAQRARVAQQVSSPDDEQRAQNREGRHGPQTSGSSVLDVAKGMGLRAGEKVRFARGTARKSRWCAVEHRVIDWASRSSSRRSSK